MQIVRFVLIFSIFLSRVFPLNFAKCICQAMMKKKLHWKMKVVQNMKQISLDIKGDLVGAGQDLPWHIICSRGTQRSSFGETMQI